MAAKGQASPTEPPTFRNDKYLLDACPELIAQPPRRARLATREEIQATQSVGSPPGLLVEQYSAPVFNDDFTEAMIGYASTCPGLCGVETVYYYRKVAGAWVLAFAWPISIS